MVFSSIVFLFRFMPIAFLCYYLALAKARNFVLLVASLIFYGWGEVRYLPVMLTVIGLNYAAALLIGRAGASAREKQLWLWADLALNLGMLVYFKYADFLLGSLAAVTGLAFPPIGLTLPLGISFYTFQTLSYTIDVYRGDVPPERNLVDMAAYVVMFPQLIAGPIVRYSDVDRELKQRTLDPERMTDGVRTFVAGLGSKVLIANNIGALFDTVQARGVENVSMPLAWLGIFAYALQIYFDFSGYSLMAIGLGDLLGFRFPKNFDYPYISASIVEFWRRWHITLGTWLREYLYIPLGGSRVSRGRLVWNLFITWAATGLWHGANWNFLLWGLWFFLLQLFERVGFGRVLARHRGFGILYVQLCLMVSWVIFANTDFHVMLAWFTRLVTPIWGLDWLYYLRGYALTFALGVAFSTPAPQRLYERLCKGKPARELVVLGVVLLASVAYLVDSTYNPFLYFRF